MIEFKKFDLRPNNSKVNFCECGHMAFNHIGFEYNNSKKECEKCMCSQYVFKIALTIDEQIKLMKSGVLPDD